MIKLDPKEVYDISKLTTEQLQEVIDEMQKLVKNLKYRSAWEQKSTYPQNTQIYFDELLKVWFLTDHRTATKDARELFTEPSGSASEISILAEAEQIINGARAEDYGDVTENFQKIADGWKVIFGTGVTPRQVGHAMIWLKTCRDLNTPKRDNLVDIAGYAGCIDKMKKDS